MPAHPATIDALVVGGGPAGLSAALWLGRHRRRTLLVDSGQQRNRFSEEIHGVLGHEGASPHAVLDQARRDLEVYGEHVDLREGEVVALEGTGGTFRAELDDGSEVRASRLVLATGVRDEVPEVEGFREHYGADLFHCPTCDGFQARDRRVAVLGWGQHVPAFAVELLDWATSVCVVTDARRPDITPEQRRRLTDRGVEVVDGEVAELPGPRGGLKAVRLADGREVSADLVFFSIAHHPVTALAAGLGCDIDAEGRLVVDDHGMTTVDGVYAAGDLTPGMQLVSVAAAKGTVAGISCATSLHGHATAADAPTPAPDARPLAPERVPDARG
jgi:thioredoxin reductase